MTQTIHTRYPSSSPSKQNIPSSSSIFSPLYSILLHPSSFKSLLHPNHPGPLPFFIPLPHPAAPTRNHPFLSLSLLPTPLLVNAPAPAAPPIPPALAPPALAPPIPPRSPRPSRRRAPPPPFLRRRAASIAGWRSRWRGGAAVLHGRPLRGSVGRLGSTDDIAAAGLRDTADIASARVADPRSLLCPSARRASSASDGRHRRHRRREASCLSLLRQGTATAASSFGFFARGVLGFRRRARGQGGPHTWRHRGDGGGSGSLWIQRNPGATGFSSAPGGAPLQGKKLDPSPGGGDPVFLQ
jgi:hypothetical protein